MAAPRLLHGDGLDLMAELDGQADLLVTDPPYRLTSGGNTGSNWHGKSWNYDNSGELVRCELDWGDWMGAAFAALKPDADAYIMSNDRNLFDAKAAAEAAGFKFHRLLTWDKGTATPNRWYMPNCEFTLYLYKGKARTINDAGSMAGVRVPHKDVSKHPTEKPVRLMQHYIANSSRQGDLVLDPFMGSGTTGVAAIRAARRFAGAELEARWFTVAEERIDLERASGWWGDLLDGDRDEGVA